MAWIYLAESEESDLPWMSGWNHSPIVKKTNTHRESSSQTCSPEKSTQRQSGMTLAHLMGFNSRDLWISFMEASHVRTSVLQDWEQAWQESEVDFSGKLSDSSKKHTRLGCFSKTCQPLGLEDLRKSSEHLPIWGMTVGGQAFLPQKLEPCISGRGGSCLPTPTAAEYGRNKSRSPNAATRHSLSTMARHNLWPTPRATDYKDCGPVGSKSQVHREKRFYLDAVVKQKDRPTGKLSPMWTEWLMGYCIGHTELKGSVMRWFLSKPKRRSKN